MHVRSFHVEEIDAVECLFRGEHAPEGEVARYGRMSWHEYEWEMPRPRPRKRTAIRAPRVCVVDDYAACFL